MKPLKTLFLLVIQLIFISNYQSFSQEIVKDQKLFKELSGRVTNEKYKSVPGATVSIVGTDIKTVSSNSGRFSLKVPVDVLYLQVKIYKYISVCQEIKPETEKITVILKKATKKNIELDQLNKKECIRYSQQNLDSLYVLEKYLKALNSNEIEKLQKFLDHNPYSYLSKPAQNQIDLINEKIEEDAYNAVVKDVSLNKILKFSEKYPDSKYKEALLNLKNQFYIVMASDYKLKFSYEELGLSTSSIGKYSCDHIFAAKGYYNTNRLPLMDLSRTDLSVSGTLRTLMSTSGSESFFVNILQKSDLPDELHLAYKLSQSEKAFHIAPTENSVLFVCVNITKSTRYISGSYRTTTRSNGKILIPINSTFILSKGETIDFGNFEAFDGSMVIFENHVEFSKDTKFVFHNQE